MPILGNPIPVSVQLWDGSPSLFVQATIRNSTGTMIGSPLSVPALGTEGLYETNGPSMPNTPFVTVEFQVFTDAGFTIPSATHTDAMDIFELLPESESTGTVMTVVQPRLVVGYPRETTGTNPLFPLAPLKNACTVLLNQNSGTLPNVSTAILNYFQQMTFSVIQKSLSGFFVQEQATNISCHGMMQTSGRKLVMTRDGQRLWRNRTLFCDTSVILQPDDVIVYLGTQFRVLEREDWNQYGFVKYGLTEDFTGSGPYPQPA